jgi:hypothetical protein
LPQQNRTENEVNAFVETLLENDRIALEGKPAKAAAKKSLVGAMPTAKSNNVPTHVIRSVAGKRVLTRIRFLCGCC